MDGFRPCKFASGCGYEVCVPEFCDAYDPEIITNADRIRAMTDEELGMFLGEWAAARKAWKEDGLGEVLGWLQQPCEEG